MEYMRPSEIMWFITECLGFAFERAEGILDSNYTYKNKDAVEYISELLNMAEQIEDGLCVLENEGYLPHDIMKEVM